MEERFKYYLWKEAYKLNPFTPALVKKIKLSNILVALIPVKRQKIIKKICIKFSPFEENSRPARDFLCAHIRGHYAIRPPLPRSLK